jgi:ADP-heptose:LPS heptosyltransferase
MDDLPKPKLLIIRFSSIGDIVLVTPVIRAIKNQIKDVELHFLTKERNALIIANDPYIDKIYTFKVSTKEIIKELKHEHFTHIVDLQKNMRSLSLALRLHTTYSTFPKLNIRKWFFTNFKLNFLSPLHVIDRYFVAVKKLGVQNDGSGAKYHLVEEDFNSVENLPDNYDNGYVAVACGSMHATKQIPKDIIIKICEEINLPVILLGDKSDRTKALEIEKTVGVKVFNVCGALNISQTAAIIAKARLMITADTGLMHIAAALERNIIAVWGNTCREFGMYAYKPENADFEVVDFEVKNLKCRPCSKLGYRQCPKHHFKCMRNQDVKAIINCANAIVQK